MKVGAALMLIGAFFLPQKTDYRWRSYSIAGDMLYVVKTVSTNAINIPIPERGATKVLEKDYQVVAIDLSGTKKKPISVKHRLQPEHPIGKDHLQDAFGYYEYIELNDNAPPILWGSKELKERLLLAGRIDCAPSEIGDVIYDRQDSRLLYLYCKKKSTAYRFELPSMEAETIPLGEAAGLPLDSEPSFYSTRGQKKVFVRVDRKTYELEVGAKDKAKKIEKIEDNLYGPEDRSAKSLIGVADGFRIYQLTQFKEKTAQLSVENEHQAPRIFSLPPAIVTGIDVKAMYLSRNNLVLWEVYGEIMGKVVIYTLNLESGAVRRAEMRYVE
jgi:hypothetical protein